MRLVTALLCGCFLLHTGCSALIIGSGKQLSELATQNQVHQTFGSPVSIGEDADGKKFEEFTTHRKIAEPWKGIYLAMAETCTLGLAEFILFPREGWIAARRSILGQTLRFNYDGAGRVTAIRMDGDFLPLAVLPR